MRYSVIAEDSKTIIMTRYITLDIFEESWHSIFFLQTLDESLSGRNSVL